MKVGYAIAGVLAIGAIGYVVYTNTRPKYVFGARGGPVISPTAGQDYLFREILSRSNAPRNT